MANKGDSTVSRIDLATGTVTATIPVPGNPTSVAVTPDGTKAYVVQSTNCPAPPEPTPPPGPTPLPTPIPTPGPTPTPTPVPPCTVAVIDTASNTVVGTMTVGHEPFAVAMSPSGGFAYVTNRADDSVSMIDTTTDTVIDELPVGETPEGIFVGFGEVYIANDVSNTVSVYREIDFSLLATIPVGASPLSVAVSPDGTTAVVGNDAGGSVSIIETGTETVVDTKAVGTNPAGVAITPNSGAAVVANGTSGTVSIVPLKNNPNEPSSTLTIQVNGSPSGVAITPTPVFLLEKVGPRVVEAGGDATYTMTYTNIGSGPGEMVTLTDSFPPELTFVSATAGGAPVRLRRHLGPGNRGSGSELDRRGHLHRGRRTADRRWRRAHERRDDRGSGRQLRHDAVGHGGSRTGRAGCRPGELQQEECDQAPRHMALQGTDPAARNAVRQRRTGHHHVEHDDSGDLVVHDSRGGVDRASHALSLLGGRSARPGSKVRGQFSLRGNGLWRLNVNASNMTLPLVDVPAPPDGPEITITAVIGADLYPSTRTFRVRRTSKPNTQRLSYRSAAIQE